MAKKQPEPQETSYDQMREKTRPLDPVCDCRGPLVYELGCVPSDNGIDPDYKDKEGVC